MIRLLSWVALGTLAGVATATLCFHQLHPGCTKTPWRTPWNDPDAPKKKTVPKAGAGKAP